MDPKATQATADRLWARLDEDMAASPFAASLRALASAEDRHSAGRPLSDSERQRLEGQGNVCRDWSRVRLRGEPGLDAGLETIRGNWFEGDVLLAGFRGEWPGPGGRAWPAGMEGCRVRDAIIGNACLHHAARVERQVIEDGAVVVGVGELDCPGPTLFGLGQAIHPGAETGARTLWLRDLLTLDDCVDALSLPRAEQEEFRARLETLLAPYRCRYGYVGRGAVLQHVRTVHSAWVGPGSVVTGASLLREAALLSSGDEPVIVAEDAWVERAMLQPGARVESGGKVSRSILLEHAEVAWGGMVSQSVIGPGTQVAKGEVTSCLLGPAVGFHHQSLLISALWPEGRGNIAYGANVGSNHTGKKPDQEIRPGEGNFFGLGCSIKFPANFEDAPYSLFATGVMTLPQRLAFPFSLVNQPVAPVEGLGPAFNEILPGWMWSDNAYALVRRAYKLLDGRKAKRHDFTVYPGSALPEGFFTSRIFAPAMARRVLAALAALKAAPAGKAHYVEEDIRGLGKNFLRGDRLPACVAAYEDYLLFFLLRTWADRGPDGAGPEVKALADAAARALGASADPAGHLAGRLGRLAGLKDALAASLARDDKRGRQVFDDYADFHDAPGEDPTLARLDREAKALRTRLEAR